MVKTPREALALCATTFRTYAAHHLAKPVPQYEKAQDNIDMARMCDEAILAAGRWPVGPIAAAAGPGGPRDIGWARRHMGQGHAVRRTGWNGKGMFIYTVLAGVYPPTTHVAKASWPDGVPYGPYVAMKTATGEVVPWLCSQTDFLADDWEEA